MRKPVGCGFLLRLTPFGLLSSGAKIDDLTGFLLIQRSPHLSPHLSPHVRPHVSTRVLATIMAK